MHDEGVPVDEWPSDSQLKWQKRSHQKNKKKRKYYSSSCIASCNLFVKHPPPGIKIFTEKVIIEKGKIRIPFGVEVSGYNRFILFFLFAKLYPGTVGNSISCLFFVVLS